MAKEKQYTCREEIPWGFDRPNPFAIQRPYDEDRIQEANRELEAYEAANNRD